MPYAGAAFVGRARELAAVDELLDRAARREAVVLDLAGEPGIGKTRLLREALDRGRARGFAACAGRGSELERELPFGLLVEMFDRPLARLGSQELPLGAEHRNQLTTVFSAFAASSEPVAASAARDRHRIGRAVARLVELLADRTPLMLVVDDVHWADAASVGVLAHLVDRVSTVPLLMAFASRSTQRPPALEAAFDRFERAGRVLRVELPPLSRAEASALIGTGMEEPVRELLMRESGGNPFYLEQLARGVRRDSGSPAPVAMAGVGVPPAVARALTVELAGLSDDVRTVAHALAVAGDDADPDVVADIAGTERAVVLRALDELAGADVVRPSVEAPAFAFRHPIVRQAVYQSASPAWRIDAHRRAAAALRDRGASTALRAHHEEYAAAPGDREAIDLLARAASECLTVAPATAVRYYRAALRLLPADESRGGAGLALQLPLALALATAGAVADSRDALRDVLAQLPERDEPRRATIVTTMAAIEHLLGRFDDARALLSRELRLLGSAQPGERAAVTQSLADNHYFAGDWQAMRDAASRAFALAEEAGVAALQAEAAAAAAVATAALGDGDHASGWLDRARQSLDASSDARLVAHLDAAFWVGLAELHLEHYGHARRVLERGVELSRRSGQESAAVQLNVGLASVCALTGDLAAGRRASTFAVDVARLLGVPNLLGWAEIARGWIALREGRLEEALEAGAHVERAVAQFGTPAVSGGVCALAEARVLVGDAREGRDALLAAAGDELQRLGPLLRTWACEVLSHAELRLADVRRAEAWAVRAGETAAVLGLGRDLAFARLAAARVALERGSLDRAVDDAVASADAAEACGALPQVVQARIVAGIASARAGAEERAVALLDAAHRDARACGALGDRNEAARAMRALGRRPGGRGGAASVSHLLSALTEREREIAGLVADRLRNREIAARLHLSEKTVERHVSRILEKLGVESRVDVARAVDRERAAN